MKPIEIFICCSNKDLGVAEKFRDILTECYGFKVFLFKHSLVPSNDFHKKILTHLKSCNIFIPFLSKNLQQSAFSNQEIGFVVSRPEVVIYPISIDGTESHDLIDHTQAAIYDAGDKYGVLKIATHFFDIVMCHEDFTLLNGKAVEGMVQALKTSSSWKTTSAIIYMFELTKKKVALSKRQQGIIIWAARNNPNVYRADQLFTKLCSFMKEVYNVTLTKP